MNYYLADVFYQYKQIISSMYAIKVSDSSFQYHCLVLH